MIIKNVIELKNVQNSAHFCFTLLFSAILGSSINDKRFVKSLKEAIKN
ncbi:hypothetical protein [Lactococcus hircilactis]|nr:hypothetical protein [Lactococcus hircilactis]